MNVLAAVDSLGNAYISVVQKLGTQEVFSMFLHSLCCLLSREEGGMSKDIIVLLDNATIHRTKLVKSVMSQWGLKVVFSSPYSPSGSPVERFFGQLKKGELMKVNKNVGKK